MKLTTEETVILLRALRFYWYAISDCIKSEAFFDHQIEETIEEVSKKFQKEMPSGENLEKWFKNLCSKIADGLKNE